MAVATTTSTNPSAQELEAFIKTQTEADEVIIITNDRRQYIGYIQYPVHVGTAYIQCKVFGNIVWESNGSYAEPREPTTYCFGNESMTSLKLKPNCSRESSTEIMKIWKLASVSRLSAPMFAAFRSTDLHSMPQVLQNIVVSYIDLGDVVSQEPEATRQPADAWSLMHPLDTCSPYCAITRLV